MFLVELDKYSGSAPLILMFEELDEEAFILLLEYSALPELQRILTIVPPERPDILEIVARVIEGKKRKSRLYGKAPSAKAESVPKDNGKH